MRVPLVGFLCGSGVVVGMSEEQEPYKPLAPYNDQEREQWTSAFKDHARHVHNMNRMQSDSAWTSILSAAAVLTRTEMGPDQETDRLALKRLLPEIMRLL